MKLRAVLEFGNKGKKMLGVFRFAQNNESDKEISGRASTSRSKNESDPGLGIDLAAKVGMVFSPINRSELRHAKPGAPEAWRLSG
jgi:hypothetical protein